MKGQELAIWNATYATAIVDLEHVGPKLGMSEGARTCRAVEMADAAVRRLRQWREGGHPKAGKRVE